MASVGELVEAVPGLRLTGDPTVSVNGIAYDSRLVGAGDLFAALRGADFDGHCFVREAAARGAAALLVEEAQDVDLPQVVANNSRAALAPISALFYGAPSQVLNVIGVTGTDGKTTTAYLIDAIMRGAGVRTGLMGTVAVRIGNEVIEHETRQTTPESADVQRHLRQMVDAGCSWATLEATSHGLDLHRLDETRFRIGAVTNITHEHLEHHKTIAGYRRAKSILFERVAEAGGIAVINVENEGAREMLAYTGSSSVLRYSVSGTPADVCAKDVRASRDGSVFALTLPGQAPVEVSLPLIGGFNVANAVCAAAVALAVGLSAEDIKRGLDQAPQVPGRMARIDEGQAFSVVVDYAHTPESLTKVLELLRGLTPAGRLIAVFGSAGERDVAKRSLQGAVAARLADLAVFTTEDPRLEDADEIIEQIAAGATAAGGERGTSFWCITDRQEAIRQAFTLAGANDCVLLAGKGHEGSIIWGREKRPWNESAIARQTLIDLGHGAG